MGSLKDQAVGQCNNVSMFDSTHFWPVLPLTINHSKNEFWEIVTFSVICMSSHMCSLFTNSSICSTGDIPGILHDIYMLVYTYWYNA